MKLIILVTVSTLVALFIVPSFVLADCIACTTSAGVTVKLKDGNTVKGYIAWNKHQISRQIGSNKNRGVSP